MKRYSMTQVFMGLGCAMVATPDGNYVLHSEAQAEIDALKAQNADLERRLNGRNGWIGAQEPKRSEEKCLYDQHGGDLDDELALS